MRPAEVDHADRRREQGPRGARLEAEGVVPELVAMMVEADLDAIRQGSW